jgi:O-antigen/teichoic acid export membrane protein
MNHKSKLAKNATYLTLASLLQKAITFGYYGFLADSIGAESLGKYTFALTVGSVFVIFMDIGLGTLLTREVAEKKDTLQETFNRFFSLKIVTIVVSLVAFFATIHLSRAFFGNIDDLDVQLLYIASAIIVFDTLTFTAFSILRSLQRLLSESIAIVLYQLTVLLVGVWAILSEANLTVILSALLCGSVLQFVFMTIAVRRQTKLTFTFHIEWDDAKILLKMAAPFAIAGIIFKLNGSVDGIMLKIANGDEAAGLYGLAFKLTFALMVIPGAFATSYYPAMSAHFTQAKDRMGPLFSQGLRYMALISFPIAAGAIVLADNLIDLLWEDFDASVTPLIIFMIALPFLFANYPIGNLLNAAHLQRRNTFQMGIALMINIAFNILLIPFYGIVGAAVAQLISSIVLAAIGLPLAFSVAPFTVSSLLMQVSRLIVSAGIMGLAVFLVQNHVHLIVSVIIGVAVYALAVLLTGAVRLSELKSMRQSLTRSS